MAKTVTALVKKELHKELEDKYAVLANAAPASPFAQTFTCAIDANSKCYPVLPQVSQGSGDFQRVGDRLTPKSLVVKFTMTCSGSPTTNSSEQLWGRLFVLQDKSIRNMTALQAIAGVQPGTPISTQLIDYGNGLHGAYTGQPYSNNFRVNKRQYRVYHDKLIKFQRGYGTLPQAANPVAWVGDQIYTSPLATHQMTLRIPCPKVLLYSAEADIWPSNFAPFFCFGYQDPQALTTHLEAEMDYRVAISWVAHFDYEDA